LSNAPTPTETVERLLAEKGVPRPAWDVLVTSGDLTRLHIEAEGYRAVHHIGPDRDLSLFDTLRHVERVELSRAEALVVTGLVNDLRDSAETYRPLLEQALLRGLPLVCANPDLVVEVAGRLYLCAGSIAHLYERMVGSVHWAGKPHRIAYQTAHAAAERVRGARVERSAIIAIGDAVRTDLAGARDYGIDSLFIASGVHRRELMPAGYIDTKQLAKLLAAPAPWPLAAMEELVW
jgi:HAD superfamily hydrolase (TIGR01459 family)